METSSMASLETFQQHIEDMRALVHCKICVKPFYEPFTLSCGHTYCYTCLTQWCGNPHAQNKTKNCPDCRTVITTQPSPNYALRDLVHMFLSRAELLPSDESVEEHAKGKAEEAKTLADDKSGLGLFRGVFGPVHPQSRGVGTFRTVGFWHGIPIADNVDNVERCPNCAWELVDGECQGCNYIHEHYDSEDSEFSHTPDETNVAPLDALRLERAHRALDTHRYGTSDGEDGALDYSDGYDESEDDEIDDEDEDEDDNSEMDSFIDDDDGDDMPDEVDEDGIALHPHPGSQAPSTVADYADDAYSYNTPREPASDDGETAESAMSPYSSYDTTTRTNTEEQSTQDDRSRATTPYDQSDYDSRLDALDGLPIATIRSGPASGSRKRPVILSDEDETDHNDNYDGETDYRRHSPGVFTDRATEDTEMSEESDDTAIRPPRNRSTRRQRLHGQRARRDSKQPYHRPSTYEASRSPSGSPVPQIARRGTPRLNRGLQSGRVERIPNLRGGRSARVY